MERARDHDAVEAGELIAGEILVGHPALHMEIFAVVRAQPHLAPGLQHNTVFTLWRIWHLSRNSLSSFREVVVTL